MATINWSGLFQPIDLHHFLFPYHSVEAFYLLRPSVLFNSYAFLLVFLPITFAGFLLLQKWTPNYLNVRLFWLTIASFYFYAYWDPALLPLLICSVVVNYGIGRALEPERQKRILTIGIFFNLGLLAYFKYTGFILKNLTYLTGVMSTFSDISLPLAISFFTFHQIAYLVDVYRGRAAERSLLHYTSFVAFFPQFIAGPITKAHEILPQLRALGRLDVHTIAVGITIFTIGLGKKVLLADQLAVFANPVFAAADAGTALTFLDAWGGVLAFSFQIYFDFSGYSDMAIGLGLLFGIRLPINFASPYRATSLIEFWHRWHITLSRFLRQYLYIPLGGNRHGDARQYANILIVMLLGGLWHGAGWTFVAWGGIHGLGLIANHLWRRSLSKFSIPFWLGWGLTFGFVSIAWVFFRAETWSGAVIVLVGLGGLGGVVLPETYLTWLGGAGTALAATGVRFETMLLFLGAKQIGLLAACLGITLLMPNTQTWIGYQAPGEAPPLVVQHNHLKGDGSIITQCTQRAKMVGNIVAWRPSAIWATVTVTVTLACLALVARSDRFIYFQF